MAKKNKCYAYCIDSQNLKGISNTWDECKIIVAGEKARYKGFASLSEAKLWLDGGALYETKVSKQVNLEDGIYFDAGTGRGQGAEVKVTDKFGNSIIDKVVPKEKVTIHGTYFPAEGSTNNFGELLGCYIALKIAIKENEKKIFGDSKLIIDYWSKGIIKREQVAEETVKLSDLVTTLRKEFEKLGGKLQHVSGDINPADLGFHK